MRHHDSSAVDFVRIAAGILLSILSACGGSGGGSGSGTGPPPGQTLQVLPVSSAVSPGNVLHLTATLMKNDGTQADVTPQATWSVSNNVVALATPGGRVIAMSPGSTIITANYQGTLGEVLLDVAGPSGTVAPGYAYFVTSGPPSGEIEQYRIDSSGFLTPLSVPNLSVGMCPGIGSAGLVTDTTRHYVYAVDACAGRIWQFAVGVGGELKPLSIPFVGIPNADVSDASATVDPQGRYLYLLFDIYPSQNSNTSPRGFIAQYRIGSDGQLSALQPFVIEAAASGFGMSIEPTGRFVYLIEAYDTPAAQIVKFEIGASGTLVPSGGHVGVSSLTGQLAIAPGGRDAYALSFQPGLQLLTGQAALTHFFIAPDGSLVATGQSTSVNAYSEPMDVVFGGAGPSVYFLVYYAGSLDSAGAVYPFQMASSGALTPTSASVTDGTPGTGVIYGPNLYVLSEDCEERPYPCYPVIWLNHFSIDQSGALRPVGKLLLPPAGALQLAIDYQDMVLVPAD